MPHVPFHMALLSCEKKRNISVFLEVVWLLMTIDKFHFTSLQQYFSHIETVGWYKRLRVLCNRTLFLIWRNSLPVRLELNITRVVSHHLIDCAIKTPKNICSYRMIDAMVEEWDISAHTSDWREHELFSFTCSYSIEGSKSHKHKYS